MAYVMSNFFGDSLPEFMTGNYLFNLINLFISIIIDVNGKFWACIIMGLFGFPPSLSRKLSALRYFFLAGVFFEIYLAFTIFGEAFNTNISRIADNYEKAKKFEFSGLSSTFPIAIFAYTCHPNVLDVYKEL